MATKIKSTEDASNQKDKTEAWRQKIADEYTYCMFSTLNQMVNYLPMLLFDFKKTKMYVTLQGDKQNEVFDRNLRQTLEELNAAEKGSNRFALPEHFLEIGDVNDVSNLQKVLGENANDKKVLWNITGGQRPFVMAVFELLKEDTRKNDIVMYLEGKKGQLTFLKVGANKTLETIRANEHGMEKYNIAALHKEWLTIPIALKLMGFTEKANYQKFPPDGMDSKPYLTLVEKYLNREHLRKQLLALNNKKQDHKEGAITYRTKSVLCENPQTYFSELDEKEVKLILAHKSRTYPFSHLLEELFAHKIWSVAKDHIAEMAVNVRLYYEDAQMHQEAEGNIVDELDLVVLTKTGQLVVFEVKSGDMHSDVAKSTKYTTYAIAGVYGKPVLLTPLLKSDLSELNKLLSECWAYCAPASAARAARRAQLPILALDGNENDDFETALKTILNIK
jgi:hypothetical protein